MSVPSDRPGLVADLFAILVADALKGVGLSLNEWIAVLNAHTDGFSVRRAFFHEIAEQQIITFASDLYEDDPDNNKDLALMFEDMPTLYKVAIMDVVDRFWSTEDPTATTLKERLERLGVVLAETAHAKLAAAAVRTSQCR